MHITSGSASRKKKGTFEILDQQLRESLYSYWTNMDHGTSMITDKERIQKEFLSPQWFIANAIDKRGCLYLQKAKVISAVQCL